MTEMNYENLLESDPNQNSFSKIVKLAVPSLLYFTKGEKGPVSRLHRNGKIVFPHRNCKLDVGFVMVDTIHHHDKFAFVEGYNVKSYPLTKESLKQIISQDIWDADRFYKAVTCDGIEGFVKRTTSGEEYFCFIDENFVFHSFSEVIISPKKERLYHTIQPWILKEEILTEEWKEIKQLYFLPFFTPLPYSVYFERINELVAKNPLLSSFVPSLKNGTIAFADLLGSSTIHQRNSLSEEFYTNYLHKLPLMLVPESVDVFPNQEILENMKHYNNIIFRWWKFEGLKQLGNYREIIVNELNKSEIFVKI